VDALVAHVVQGEANPRVRHAQTLVHLVEEHGHQSGLPIMAVDDLELPVGFEQELHRRPGKEGKALPVVALAVAHAADEEIVVRMGINEEAFQALHPPTINGTRNPQVVIGHPQVAIDLVHSLDSVIAHAIVFGQDNLDGMAAHRKLPGQALNDVSQTAHFGRRSALGCDHHNEHT